MQINEYYGLSEDTQLQVLLESAEACFTKVLQLIEKRFPAGSLIHYRTQFMEQPHKGTVKRVEWSNRKPHLVIFDHYHGFELPIYPEHICHENENA